MAESRLGRIQVRAWSCTPASSSQDFEVFTFAVADNRAEAMWPAFQFVPPLAGATMAKCMEVIRAQDGPTAWHFISTPCPELEYLTPVELLLGGFANERPLDVHANDLLFLPECERRRLVMAAARCFSADTSVGERAC
jgi:hypothetical protein